ncbi:hypothetical protein F5888DRAFT_1807997 [Russula emetica]|nr:hypothetical protein F5888DRAFT_1807997 [Russula emetica]
MTVNGLQVLDDSNSRVQFGPNYNRLQQLKAQYDPESVFPKWFSLFLVESSWFLKGLNDPNARGRSLSTPTLPALTLSRALMAGNFKADACDKTYVN